MLIVFYIRHIHLVIYFYSYLPYYNFFFAGGHLPPGLATGHVPGYPKPLAQPLVSELTSALDRDFKSHSESMQKLEDAVNTGRKMMVVHTITLAVIFASLLGLVSYIRQRRRVDNDERHVMPDVEDADSTVVNELKMSSLAKQSEIGLFPVDWSTLKNVKLAWNN